MKLTHYLLMLSLFFSSCKTYVQVFDTGSENIPVVDDKYVFENDTLRIEYTFWRNGGVLDFVIYNKLAVPIYIDWKKCAYIDNDVKLNYWEDEELSNSISSYGNYFYPGSKIGYGATTSAKSGKSRKVERVTFIPPNSLYKRAQFYIFPYHHFPISKKKEPEILPRNDNPKKKTKVYGVKFPPNKSPIEFRNFLTFSVKENFENEFYIDNSFYVTEVRQMEKKHFSSYKRDPKKGGIFFLVDEYGEYIKVYYEKKETRFYKVIDPTIQ